MILVVPQSQKAVQYDTICRDGRRLYAGNERKGICVDEKRKVNAKRRRTPVRLSKSRIQSGRQCYKRLWLELHEPQAVDWSDTAQARLDEGTAFGELARDLLGGGLLIEADHFHVREALTETALALSRPRKDVPRLFEAAFAHQGVRVRVDALERGLRSDTLIEVKSTTQVKDEHVWDCAIQTWVVRGAGRPLRRVLLAHADSNFVYTRKGDYDGLLVTEDITERVETMLPQIPGIVAKLKKVAAGSMPRIATSAHCHEPYDCPLLAHCQSSEPALPKYSVDILPRGAKLAEWLRSEGYLDLRDVPEDLLERDMHKRVAAATRDGKAFVSKELPTLLDAIPYPRFYLDFETIRFVVPRWLKTRPFEQIPFQFSCHVETARKKVREESFLDTSGDSPLAAFSDRLVEVLGKKGPILVWNKGFEGSRIADLEKRFPKQRAALLRIIERLVDLLPIYREHYYHRDMLGSWSIKNVLPTIAPDLDYSNLAVGDGNEAQTAWHEAIHAETSAERQKELRKQLLDYCGRDTMAMVRLARWRPDSSDSNREAKV